jgi:hypothetical protein
VRDGTIEIRPGTGGESFVWALWTRAGKTWTFHVVSALQRDVPFNAKAPSDSSEVVVTAVNRLGVESRCVRLALLAAGR